MSPSPSSHWSPRRLTFFPCPHTDLQTGTVSNLVSCLNSIHFLKLFLLLSIILTILANILLIFLGGICILFYCLYNKFLWRIWINYTHSSVLCNFCFSHMSFIAIVHIKNHMHRCVCIKTRILLPFFILHNSTRCIVEKTMFNFWFMSSSPSISPQLPTGLLTQELECIPERSHRCSGHALNTLRRRSWEPDRPWAPIRTDNGPWPASGVSVPG